MIPEDAIRVASLSKCYRIYQHPRDLLKQALCSRLYRVLGRRRRPVFYREFWALRDVSFALRSGETVGIIGRNGSGKSTLLQLICGTLTPTSGEVRVKGRIAALLELGAGFNPEFTGRENVFMNGAILGLDRTEITRRYGEIAAFADIGDFIDQPVKTYSSGMYVRLAFAIAAHVDADILVIDEALSVGDAFFTQKCMRFLREFQKRGTILFVSHDAAAVTALCQRALWLDKGAVCMAGAAKDVCEAYLASQFEAVQGKSQMPPPEHRAPLINLDSARRVDQRLRYLNHSSYRNDVEVFAFRPFENGFGKGGAEILEVALLDESGQPLVWIVGGEEVTLVVRAAAHQMLSSPIIGFFIKDRLGQYLFGDNTYLSYAAQPVAAAAGEALEARFRFRLPVLPIGDYSICVALADGTQESHVQHRWIHDALLLKSRASSVVTGMIGIPMQEITLENLSMKKMAE